MLVKQEIILLQENFGKAHSKLDAMLRAAKLYNGTSKEAEYGLKLLIIGAATELESLCSSLVFEMTGGPAATEVHHA